ncbi:FAD-dependent monooxygenase [Legionella sp. CNM-4043-24]|uniref:FAD-dependent monooxygenase n=1 Tax=Legionella sp. CNM-4043-24 TaxID=3421646 RepID=UPI00403ADAEE
MDLSLDRKMDAKRPDVLVVGAGPVGLFCANELIRQGLTCRILDKKSSLSEHSKALGIHIRTLDVLQDTGFLDAFLAKGLAVHGLTLKSSGHCLASLDFKNIGSSRDYLIDLPQDQSEAILYQGLLDKGVQVEWQTELLNMEQTADQVIARIRQADGSETDIHADWIIACDGAHSRLRHLIHADFAGSAYEQNWWLADLHINWSLPEDRMMLNASLQGPLACFPMGNKRYRLVMTAPDDNPSPGLADIQQAFNVRSSDAALLSDPVWITPFSIHHRQIQQYRHQRLFFCGDAAHIHSPMGGQGLNTGIQDVYNLVWKLALVQQGNAADSLLDSYHEERYPVGKAVLKKTDAMTRMLLIKQPFLLAMRNRLIHLLASFSAFRRMMARDLAELNISYAKSPIVKSMGRKTRLKAGEYAPHMLLKNLQDRSHLTLNEICADNQHHLFLFVGKEDRVSKTSMKAAVLAPKFRNVLQVHVILLDTPSVYPESLSIWIDVNQSIHQQFRLEAPTAMLIRPDKYIGLVQSPMNLVDLQAWLHHLFTSAPADEGQSE